MSPAGFAPANPDMRETALMLTGHDQTPVPSVLSHPPEPTNRAVILCHGFLSDMNSRTNRRLTDLLTRAGCATFRFDWYGMGTLRDSFEQLALHRCLDQLTAIIPYLQSHGYTSLGLIGSSFGGFLTIAAAARWPVFQAIGLKCPVIDFAENLQMQFGTAGMDHWQRTNHIPDRLGGHEALPLAYAFFEECVTYDGYALASRLSVPTRVVHGEQDALIPFHQIERFLARLPGTKDLRLLPLADHQFGRPEDFRLMTVLLSRWMIDHLTPEGHTP